MLNLIKNMVKENGIRKTLNYLSTNEFSEKELKELIYGIEQRYYTTEIGNEKRLANSVIKL